MATKTKPWKFEPCGAKCAACKQHMLVADGCTICLLVLKDGKRVDPRKYEGGWDPGTGRCHDCGAKIGHYHHPGCDVERCPVCSHHLELRRSEYSNWRDGHCQVDASLDFY